MKGTAMTSTTRTPTQQELPRAAEIAQLAFQRLTLDHWLRSYNWIAENRGLDYLVVVEAGGELVSSLLCTPAQARFGDDIVPLSAVGGVATLPEHRCKGYAGLMMEQAVKLLYDKGYVTSALWPFSYEYYRKYGWEVGSETRRYTVPSELALAMAQPEGVRPGQRSDLAAISALVDRFARRYNCVSVRDELWWSCTLNGQPQDSINPEKGIWVHEKDGEIDGYAIGNPNTEGEETVFGIMEIITDTPEARWTLLSHFASTGADKVGFVAPADDGFLQEMPNPRLVKCEINPGFQFRVHDPLAALEMRTTGPTLSGSLGFHISDPVLGPSAFSVEASGGKITETNSTAKERLSMTIQTFSQIYCGYLRPARAFELGRIEATSPEAIEFATRLFPDTTPFRSGIEAG